MAAVDAAHRRDRSDACSALAALCRCLVQQPCHHSRQFGQLLQGVLQLLQGQRIAITDNLDPRLRDPLWEQPADQLQLQLWQLCRNQGRDWLDGLQLAPAERSSLGLLCRQLADALSPANSPLSPLLRQQLAAQGPSMLANGALKLAADLLLEQPLAPLADHSAYLPGRTLATSEGQVVLRLPMFELIRYQPLGSSVYRRPLLMVPPPINRFYLLDLTPQQSLVQHALAQGHQVFMISWRNPNPSHCQWGFNHYIRAIDQALDACSRICDGQPVNLLGVCSGGILTLLLQGLLQTRDQQQRLASASYLVTPIDSRLDTDMTRLLGPASLAQLRRRVWQQGYLNERQLIGSFAWMRPQLTVWPQASQRYLEDTPASSDPLDFWSQDATRLPARLVEDLLQLLKQDPLGGAQQLWVYGQPVNLQRLQIPSWHMGAERDHIVPWQNCWPGQRMGGERTFVLSSGGHVQSLLNAPASGRGWHATTAVDGDNPAQWSIAGSHQPGSWWRAWTDWLAPQAGDLQDSSTLRQHPDYPPLQAAPGRYVHQL